MVGLESRVGGVTACIDRSGELPVGNWAGQGRNAGAGAVTARWERRAKETLRLDVGVDFSMSSRGRAQDEVSEIGGATVWGRNLGRCTGG